jgi:hypothetical protein
MVAERVLLREPLKQTGVSAVLQPQGVFVTHCCILVAPASSPPRRERKSVDFGQ